MEADGVDVHTFFSNISGVAGNTFSNPEFEEEYRIEAIRAYNDYQVEEWSTPYPGRFITLTQVPMWDVNLAVEEAYRGKRMGMNGLTFAFPQQFGYPHIADPYWDPLWAAAQETGLSVNLHIGSGGSMGITDTGRWEGQHRLFGSAEGSVKTISANIQVMSTILFSNILERFPGVKFVSSESGIGWVPYLLEVSDHQHQQQALARIGMPLKPSEYFHRQCYVNFWFEENGPAQRGHHRRRKHHVGIGLPPPHLHLSQLPDVHRTRHRRLERARPVQGPRRQRPQPLPPRRLDPSTSSPTGDPCKTPSRGRTPPAGLGKGRRRGVLLPLPLGEGWGEGGGRRGPRDLAEARPPS